MAAVAIPREPGTEGRRSTTAAGRRRRSKEGSHLRLVPAPLFDEPIFDELQQGVQQAPSEWSVWQRPLPSIPQRQIVTRYTAFEELLTVPAVVRPAPNRGTPSHPLLEAPLPKASPAQPLPVAPSVARVAPRTSSRPTVPAGRYRLRRLLACLLLGALLLGALSGASALASLHQGRPVALAGSVPVAGGYEYTFRPGDTLWSIASRVYPQGDPRALVAKLESELSGSAPLPGEHLILP